MLVAVVRGEHLAQALDGASGLVVAQARKGRARVLKAADGRERGVDVVSVEDRLVDVLEAHAVEAGGLEEAGGGVGIAERERVRFEDVNEPVFYGYDVDAALAIVRGFQDTSAALARTSSTSGAEPA